MTDKATDWPHVETSMASWREWADMDLITAVIEWRDARQAFFDAEGKGITAFTADIWSRMGNAEHRLMIAARALDGAKSVTWHHTTNDAPPHGEPPRGE